MKKDVKALVLFSGGLDSILAVKILEEQGVEVEGVCCTSNFYGCDEARKSAENIGMKLNVVDVGGDILDLVKNPPSGLGKNMNPCIDCHAMMMKKANVLLKEKGFDFIATGEVVGQRPFSQNKDALGRVKKLSEGDVLRPLSAKLLEETEIEKSGLVDRNMLGEVSGRSRDGQMILVKKYGLKDFPSPAGGCLLTDPIYGKRLKKMLENWAEAGPHDVALLKAGRIFWFNVEGEKVLVVIGRHKEDNDLLNKLGKVGDIVLELKGQVGPLVLVRGTKEGVEVVKEVDVPEEAMTEVAEEISRDEFFETVMKMTGYFSVKARGLKSLVELRFIK